MAETIETAALGRPLQLGMLYNCRKDAIVPGITLWDREQLQQNTVGRTQYKTELNVTTSDTIQEKAKHLNVDGELKLSLLGGNVMVNGAARYFNDTKKSFKQERLMLHYRTSTKFEQLTMNHLAHGKMGHHDVFDYDVATHVVTAVLYGADAYFVFDRDVSLEEKQKDTHGEVNVALDKLKTLFSAGAQVELNLNESEKAAVKKLTCTFYGDFMLHSNPTTFEDAVKVYTDLTKMLGENGEHAVPVKVWLFPLVKLDSRAAKLHRNITTELIRAVESVIEDLNVTEMKCGDLLQDTVAKSFSTFHSQVQDFQKFCFGYKQDFMKKVASLLPEIRGGESGINALSDLLEAHEESPFNIRDLQHWITVKEKKSFQVKALLKQLHELGAEVNDDIHKYLLDLNVENLVSYAFTCLQHPDLLLTKQKKYLDPLMMKRISENTLDLDFHEIMSTSDDLMCMKNNLIIFNNLITSNKSQSTKFIVQSVPQSSNCPSSCILVYENGCNEALYFVPPSKPPCPIIEGITDNSLTVKLSSPCAATLERKLLYKMKLENDWKSQPVEQDINTLSDLKPGTDYEIKCEAVGKLHCTVESDVITVKTMHSVVECQMKLTTPASELTQKVVGKIEFVLSGNKYFILVTGKTLNSHKEVIVQLKKKVPRLQEVKTVNECDFILVFCPVVSQAGTDIEAAVKKLHDISATKPAVLVVLHHTFNPETVVLDSSRAVNRENTITVDCLFHEDQGLLHCKKNYDAINYIEMQLKPKIQKPALDWRGLFNTENRPERGSSTQQPCATSGNQNNQEPAEFKRAVSQVCWEIKQLQAFKNEIVGKEAKIFSNKEVIITTELRLVLLGRTGTDKTAAKNIILDTVGRNQAATSTTTATQQSESARLVARRKVIVVDTPDLFSHGISIEELGQTVGPQAFLLVIPVNHSEDKMQTEDETQGTLSKMEEIFGERHWRNTMILFTVSDKAKNKKIEEFIQSEDLELRKLVEKCGNSFHCLNIKESGDGSEVSELLEKIEKMVEGNRNGAEIDQIIKDMEKEKYDKDAWIRVQQKMQKTLERCEQFIKYYEDDLKCIGTGENNAVCREMVEELKKQDELKRDIGVHIKKMYDRVAGLEENRQFIKVILPENQQTIWPTIGQMNRAKLLKSTMS